MSKLDFSEYKKQAATLEPSSFVEEKVLSYARSAASQQESLPVPQTPTNPNSQFQLTRRHLLVVGISLAACLLQFFGIGAHTIHPASLIEVSANAAMNLETAPFETAPSIQQPPLTNIEIRLFAFVEAPEANADTIAIGDITLLFEESSQITSDVSVHFTLPEAIDKDLDIQWQPETSSYRITARDNLAKFDTHLSEKDALALYEELQNIAIVVSNSTSTKTYTVENAGKIAIGEIKSNLRYTGDQYIEQFTVRAVE